MVGPVTSNRWRGSRSSCPRTGRCREFSWRMPGVRLRSRGRGMVTRLFPIEKAAGRWSGPARSRSLEGWRVPHELTVKEIAGIRESFRKAAIRAREAGFRWLEIHGAHGYLLHSFYSPLSNHRTDEYGGSLENRTRFLVETARVVRAEWPKELPLSVRLSCTDWVEGGWTLEDRSNWRRR